MGRDKALLPFRDTTFLNNILNGFLPRLDPLIVVLGCHAEAIRESIRVPSAGGELGSAAPGLDQSAVAATDSRGVRVVVNADYRRGMLSSLQTGIAALPESAEAAMFTLVDHPDVAVETFDKLLAVYRETGAPLNHSANGRPPRAPRYCCSACAGRNRAAAGGGFAQGCYSCAQRRDGLRGRRRPRYPARYRYAGGIRANGREVKGRGRRHRWSSAARHPTPSGVGSGLSSQC